MFLKVWELNILYEQMHVDPTRLTWPTQQEDISATTGQIVQKNAVRAMASAGMVSWMELPASLLPRHEGTMSFFFAPLEKSEFPTGNIVSILLGASFTNDI